MAIIGNPVSSAAQLLVPKPTATASQALVEAPSQPRVSSDSLHLKNPTFFQTGPLLTARRDAARLAVDDARTRVDQLQMTVNQTTNPLIRMLTQQSLKQAQQDLGTARLAESHAQLDLDNYNVTQAQQQLDAAVMRAGMLDRVGGENQAVEAAQTKLDEATLARDKTQVRVDRLESKYGTPAPTFPVFRPFQPLYAALTNKS